MCQIFISYSSKDYDLIKKELVPFLEQKGLKPWLAKDNIHSGNGIIEIFENLQRSDYFLLVMSKDSKESKWVKAETYAWFVMERNDKRFFSFRIDDKHKREDFHPQIPPIQSIKYDKNNWDDTKKELDKFFLNRDSMNSGNRLSSNEAKQNLLTRQLISIFLRNSDYRSLWEAIKKACENFSLSDIKLSDDIPSYRIKNKLDKCSEDDLLLKYFWIATYLSCWSPKLVIENFIARLYAYLPYGAKSSLSQQKIRDKLEKIVEKNNEVDNCNFYHKVKKIREKQDNEIVYLIINIKDLSQSQPDLFQIHGWWATDGEMKSEELLFKNLPLQLNQDSDISFRNRSEPEISYSFEQLKKIIKCFIEKTNSTVEEILGEPPEKLIIDFFLPDSLLDWDVDKWDVYNDGMFLGRVYETRICSQDRFKPRYVSKKTWRHKWKLVEINNIERSWTNCNCNDEIGLISAQLNNDILGLKLISPLKSDFRRISPALYYSGTPIALWFRHSPQGSSPEAEFNKLLQPGKKFKDISKEVRQYRYKEKDSELSLLWDNPNLTNKYKKINNQLQ